jgi:hypothetical protein
MRELDNFNSGSGLFPLDSKLRTIPDRTGQISEEVDLGSWFRRRPSAIDTNHDPEYVLIEWDWNIHSLPDRNIVRLEIFHCSP